MDDFRAKEYKNVLLRGGQAYGEIARALPVVRDFIRETGRILYGGMAIDYALKAAGGEGIYPPDTVPDYDIMSPAFYEDSNEIARRLFAMGMQSAQAINAQHITSRRVRIQFEPVADVTYIPADIYDRLPTFEYDGFRVIHPDFQRLDMHRAFCYMLEKPPGEVIRQRIHKDIKRFPLLTTAYPIDVERMRRASLLPPPGAGKKSWAALAGSKAGGPARRRNGTAGDLTMRVERRWLERGVLGGWAALAVYECALTRISRSVSEKSESGEARCEEDEEGISIWMKGWGRPPIHITTDEYQTFEGLGRCQYYSRFLDSLYPRLLAVTISDADGSPVVLEVADNAGMLTPVVDMGTLLGGKGAGIRVAAGHHTALYMLLRAFQPAATALHGLEGKEATATYLGAYERVCALMTNEKLGLGLTLTTYGRANLSPDYLAAMAEKVKKMGEEYVPGVDLSRAPAAYYLEKGRDPEPFLIRDTLELFAIDGRERKPFVPLIPSCMAVREEKQKPQPRSTRTGRPGAEG